MLCLYFYKIIFITVTLFDISNANEFKLSDSKVLIPRSSFLSINYTIKGSRTICHEWFSDTPEVVTMTPIFDPDSRCSHESVITSVWQSNHRATATVYAKNIATGHVVKCDVIIDNIHQLTIETRTLELYLHETPEALIAKAYDEYGNTFSTLDGIPFEWSIHASGVSTDGQNVLRFITWTESEYITPILIGALEQQGLQGYMQLVSGLKTGAARISLILRDDKLKHTIKSSEVRLLVMANAVLSPPLAYVVPHTQISYKVLVHSQGSTQEIKMPNNQYYLKINDTELAELDIKGSTLTAKKFGQTEVILIDKNINEDFRHPSSILYIVEPGFLTFHISPGENQWVLQSGLDNIYTITVRPYDFNSHQIYMSDNMRLETRIPTEYFEILYSTENGTYSVVRAIKEGQTTLKSNFSFILLQNGTTLKLEIPIIGSQELTIYPPIIVIPSVIVIPWYPNGKSVPGYLFKAIGGSGEYKWMVSDSSLCTNTEQKSKNSSVSIDSLGYVKPQKLGISCVVAADQRNMLNRGISIVSVDTIRSISLLLYQVEVEVDHLLDLPLKAVNNKNEVMSHCHWLPFELSLGDSTKMEIVEVISSQESNISEACALIKVRGRNPGFSKITVSLLKLLSSTKEFLTTSITIGAFRHTKFIDSCNGFCTVGVLSTKMFHIVDGPLPWTLDPSRYFYEYKDTNQSLQVLKKLSLKETDLNSKLTGLLLKIQCTEIGEVDISVLIGNSPSTKNPYPSKSIGTMRLSCTLPVFMKLIPKLVLSNISQACPYENYTEGSKQITVNNKRPLQIEVLFSDRNGNQLDKSESFAIDVEITSLVSSQNVNSIVKQARPKIEYVSSNEENGLSAVRSYFEVSPKESGVNIGDIHVKAISNSYRHGKGPKFHLESGLNIRISKSMVVEPTKLILYQHEKITGKLTVKYGSGHFVVLPPVPNILKVNLLLKSVDNDEGAIYEVKQTNIDKSQRNGLIQISDTCFNAVGSELENFKTVLVELVRPFKLQVLSLNKMQLGSQISVLLQVFDDTGREFPSEYLNMLDFEFLVNDNSNIISTHSLHSKEWIIAPCELSKSSGLIFRITGEMVGLTSFSVILKQNKDITSNVQKIEVFPPLKLTPKNTVLLEGTEIQLTGTGGPQCCQEMIRFSIIKNSTLGSKEAKIEFVKGPNGLIRGIFHGSHAVKVRIEISDSDPSNGNQLTVLSQDDGLVGVVQIKSMSIHSPTNRLIVGNTMPLWITFASTLNDLEHLPVTGFSLAGKQKSTLSFKWQLNPPQGVITNLGNFLEPAGINIGTKYLHSGMRIHSLNPGKQKIEVTVSGLPQNWLSKDLNKLEPLVSKLNIAIISRLQLLEPSVAVRTLLLPPNSKISLRSSLDNEAVVTYSLSHYDDIKIASNTRSRIRSGNILETSNYISNNEEEQFVLNIKSSQPIKLNAANEFMGNQSLALFVTVKHPTYSMLSPCIYHDSIFQKFKASKESSHNSDVAFLPLGGQFVFHITSHDELGNNFDVSPDSNTISYQLHRSDNLAISIVTEDHSKLTKEVDDTKISKTIETNLLSSTKLLQLQGLSSGDNILQLLYQDSASESTHITDIVSIPTEHVLHCLNYNQKTYIEGLKLKYVAPFDHGFWSSSDPDTVSVDSASGEVILKKEGTSNIFYSLTNVRNIKGQPNKNVLISEELRVLPANRLTLKIVDGFLPTANDVCSREPCVPINFDFHSQSLLASVYVYSSFMRYEKIDDKFEKESFGNLPLKFSEEIPIECNIDFDFGENSVFRHDLFEQLLHIELLPIHAEYDSTMGIRQWACYFSPRPLSVLSNDDLVSILLSIKYDIKVHIRARLRYSDMKSDTVSVPLFTGYVLLMSNDSRTTLKVKSSGEVLTDIRIVISPSTKHLMDSNKNVVLSVVSSKPNLLEVLAPRQSGLESGIWVYPLKAVVVNKGINDRVEITISFPLTRQMDKISVAMDIIGKSSDEKQSKDHYVQSVSLTHVNWVRPVICVIITGAIAIMIVMLVNSFVRPSIDYDLISSPSKDGDRSFGSTLPYTSLMPTSRLTQHIWNNPNIKKDSSPSYFDYSNQRHSRASSNMTRL